MYDEDDIILHIQEYCTYVSLFNNSKELKYKYNKNTVSEIKYGVEFCQHAKS